MGSEYFPGRVTPETWVGTGGNRKWMDTTRRGSKTAPNPREGGEGMRKEMPHQDVETDADTESMSDEDEYTENQYSESEFDAEQEEDNQDVVEEPEKYQPPVQQSPPHGEEAHVEVSQHPPPDFEADSHLLHIDFVAGQLERFDMSRPANSRRAGTAAKKLPGQQHNISFSRYRVREIERSNQILLRRILTTRPTLQTQPGLLRPTKSTGSTNTSRDTSAALNRKKMQKKIVNENEILLRKVNSFGLH